jgi:energy-coupling factor transport system permease protein
MVLAKRGNLNRIDPRTKLTLGLTAIAAVFIAHRPEILIAQGVILCITIPMIGLGRIWIRSFRLFWPMVCIVFVISFFSFDVWLAFLLSVRLFNLLTVSFIFFHTISSEEMGDGLRKIRIPYVVVFILTTAMHYVPLIGSKIRNIINAQQSRGIDLRPRLKNAVNFMALLTPLLVQSFLMSDELAMAMETRGFGRKGRSFRRKNQLTFIDWGLLTAGLIFLLIFIWWERG